MKTGQYRSSRRVLTRLLMAVVTRHASWLESFDSGSSPAFSASMRAAEQVRDAGGRATRLFPRKWAQRQSQRQFAGVDLLLLHGFGVLQL